jgi:integrase
VLLGGEAGLRCGEMMALEWTDVDPDKRQLCVQRSEWKGHVTTPKGGRLRYIPLTGRLGAYISRHTFCSHLAMRGAPTRAIQELAGHRDLVTTQRYMHLSPAAIEGAIRLLESGTRSGFGNMLATADAPAQ